MKQTIIATIFHLAFLIPSNSIGQESNTWEEKYISAEALQEDFKLLYDVLISYHPEPFEYISQQELEQFKEASLKLLTDSLTESSFHVIVRKLIAELKCGHTYAKPSTAWYSNIRATHSIIPFGIKVFDNKVYINSLFVETDNLAVLDEVLAINGNGIEQVLNNLNAIKERDGVTTSFVDHKIQESFRIYYLFVFGISPQYRIKVKRKNGAVQTVTLPAVGPSEKVKSGAIEKSIAELPPEMKLYLENSWGKLYIDTSSNVSYLKIDGFSRGHFKKFYKTAFSIISEKQSPRLIIDLRNNGGGYFPNGNNLLTYLSDKPFEFIFYTSKKERDKNPWLKMNFGSRLTKTAFNAMPNKNRVEGRVTHGIKYKLSKKRYHGETYVIINGGSFSLGSYIAAFLKYNTGAMLFGSETGGAEYGSNALLEHKLVLPNSKIEVAVPYYHLCHNLKIANSGKGVKPTVPVPFTLEDYLSDEDLILKEVLK